MRLEYEFELAKIEMPRFSIEAEEGIGKLFTLATLVLNVLETHTRVEIVFHGLNGEDPRRKIEVLKEILRSSSRPGNLVYKLGQGDAISHSSAYYQWLEISRE